MRHHEGTTLFMYKILPVSKAMRLSHIGGAETSQV